MSEENPYESLSREDLMAICLESKQIRTALISTIRERVEGISELPENHCHHSIGMSSCDYCDGLSDGVDKFLSLLTEIEGEMK